MAMKRIIMHWTAGGHNANASDRKHYHEIVEGDGSRVEGDKLPEANNATGDGHYAAHTRGLNTGSIGLSMACMSGARHSPFAKGRYAMTPVQLNSFVEMVAEYAETYDIDVTRDTILTHAEVQPTLGVRQNGKWDITWLPGMAKPGHPIEIGDYLRDLISNKLSGNTLEDAPVMAGLDEDAFTRDLAVHISEFFKSRRV